MVRSTERMRNIKRWWRHRVVPRHLGVKLRFISSAKIGRLHIWAYRSGFQQKTALERISAHVLDATGLVITTEPVIDRGRLKEVKVTRVR
jgi:hypothetical protein